MDKNKKAVAIEYNPKRSQVPQIIAKGKGLVAENILIEGSKQKVPIIENKGLVEDLVHMNIGDDIPEELYRVVSEILVFVNDLDELESRAKGHE